MDRGPGSRASSRGGCLHMRSCRTTWRRRVTTTRTVACVHSGMVGMISKAPFHLFSVQDPASISVARYGHSSTVRPMLFQRQRLALGISVVEAREVCQSVLPRQKPCEHEYLRGTNWVPRVLNGTEISCACALRRTSIRKVPSSLRSGRQALSRQHRSSSTGRRRLGT